MTALLWESKLMIRLHLLLSLLHSVHNKTDEFAGQTICFIMMERTYGNLILLINIASVIATEAAQFFYLSFCLFFSAARHLFTVFTISSSNNVVKQ